MTAALWSRAHPCGCACGDAYIPVRNRRGKLVKSREPAWRMMEQTRDPGCLQEHFRALAKVYRLSYQHHKLSKGSGTGYPDVHMWTPLRGDGGGSVYVELKRMGRDPTDEQVRVMAEIQDAGHLVYLARPCCLLLGVADELMAAFAGRPCLYVKAGRAYTPVEVPDGAPIPAVTRSLPLYRQPAPPGADPVPFAPAVCYIIPPGAGGETLHILEVWLRDAGIPPTSVPYPMRLIVGDRALHAHCRVGLARQGHDVRVWRGGVPTRPFPDHLVHELRAEVVHGASSTQVAGQVYAEAPAAASF